MKSNYHTHTQRCNHAVGDDEAYVQRAINGGFDILGFSDHTPWPFDDGYISGIRMRTDELDGYVESIRHLRDKYCDQIEVKVGLECEFYVDHIEWLREQKERLKLDYLIFGNHFPYREMNSLYFGESLTHNDLKLYLESATKAMESGLFEYFAHPELFMRTYPQIDKFCLEIFRELATVARDLGIIFEHNISMKYNSQLWEVVADVKPKVIVGLDAHDSKILKNDNAHAQGRENLRTLGITPICSL